MLALEQFSERNLQNLLPSLLQDDTTFLQQIAESSGFNIESIYLYVHSLLVPFAASVAKPYYSTIKEKGTGSVCPFCGSSPSYAVLDKEDGHRELFCPLCQSRWGYRRVTCHNCGNADEDSLKIFYLHDDQSHRADVCLKCKRYIKTTNERLLGDNVIPQIEDVITMEIDAVATKEGFKK